MGDKLNYKQIPIELNNIGGSLAKNIVCTLSLSNYEEVLTALENAKSHFKIDFLRSRTAHIDDFADMETRGKRSVLMIVRDDKGNQKTSLGSVYNKYEPEFIGTCLPLALNHEANVKYLIEPHVSYWVDYIVQKRNYAAGMYNVNELFNFNLEVKYSSDEYGDYSDTFNLKWECIGIWTTEDAQLIFKYVLKSTKVNTQA